MVTICPVQFVQRIIQVICRFSVAVFVLVGTLTWANPCPAFQTNSRSPIPARTASSDERATQDAVPADQPSQFDGQAAYQTLLKICEIGPRVSGSEGMRKQQLIIKEHFEGLGAKVTGQSFSVRNPSNGQPTTLTNIIVRFHPERRKRLLICCHYDTRPFADRDPR